MSDSGDPGGRDGPDFEYEILGPDDDDPSPGPWSPAGSGTTDVSPSPSSGPGSGPAGRSALMTGGVLALAGLIVAVLAFGAPGQWSREVATRPAPTPSPAPSEAKQWTITGPDIAPSAPPIQLSVVPLCDPITDGGTRLWVAFEVVNSGATAFTLLDVRPRLPRRGLVKLDKVRAGGSCGEPGDQPLDQVLAPTQQVLVTMQLKVLDTCPQPAPFGVRVRADFASGPSSLSFPLFADLASVAFSGC